MTIEELAKKWSISTVVASGLLRDASAAGVLPGVMCNKCYPFSCRCGAAPQEPARPVRDGWAVMVEVDGKIVLTISNQHYSGISDIEVHADVIRTAAQNLLGFIDQKPAQADAQVAKPIAADWQYEQGYHDGWTARYGDGQPNNPTAEILNTYIALLRRWVTYSNYDEGANLLIKDTNVALHLLAMKGGKE